MNIAFVYPDHSPHDALADWVRTLARHSIDHAIRLVASPQHTWADIHFLLTQSANYPPLLINQHISQLTRFAVIHNEDTPGVPTPGKYRSFCWTLSAQRKLAAYSPLLVRQPCLVGPTIPTTSGVHIATFGHIEPKKRTIYMAEWATQAGYRFTAVAPDTFSDQYAGCINMVRNAGGKCILHPWHTTIEDLGRYFNGVTHFLFVLTNSKRGRGGSPTSPHYATYFGRPVIVVDDEPTFGEDGMYVFDSLESISGIEQMVFRQPQMTVDYYLDTIIENTL